MSLDLRFTAWRKATQETHPVTFILNFPVIDEEAFTEQLRFKNYI
jgi:hypothetical protein